MAGGEDAVVVVWISRWLVERTPSVDEKKKERRGLLVVVDCGTAERENKRG